MIWYMKSFGQNIKRYRLIKGWTQKQLGEKLGFSARTISDWECGNTEPAVAIIKKLCEILDVSLDDLFDF